MSVTDILHSMRSITDRLCETSSPSDPGRPWHPGGPCIEEVCAQVESAAGRAGIRERKKARTRIALCDAALKLFSDRGYAATTVDDIAAAVEVSPRTFFRYFAGKEDVALSAWAELEDVMLATFQTRPAEEGPLAALDAATRAMLAYARAERRWELFSRFRTCCRLIEATPALRAASLARHDRFAQRLTELTAARLGVPAGDLRARVIVYAYGAVVRGAMATWVTATSGAVDELERLISEALRLLAAQLAAERWCAAEPPASRESALDRAATRPDSAVDQPDLGGVRHSPLVAQRSAPEGYPEGCGRQRR